MTAAERLAKRNALVADLARVDRQLKGAFGMAPSNRVSASARKLLRRRDEVCDELRSGGYRPWGLSLEELGS